MTFDESFMSADFGQGSTADVLLERLSTALRKGGADAEAEADEYVDALEQGAWEGVPALLTDVDDIEVSGCAKVEAETQKIHAQVEHDDSVEVCADDDAEFFTVYLRREGEAAALWDVPTRASAERLARLLLMMRERRSS